MWPYKRILPQRAQRTQRNIAVAALVAAVSALALERGRVRSVPRAGPAPGSTARPDGEGDVSVAGWPPMARENAQLVLVGVSFVAGLMGSFAAEGAANIVGRLQEYPELLDAACTFSKRVMRLRRLSTLHRVSPSRPKRGDSNSPGPPPRRPMRRCSAPSGV
jgi:hypothetical protein